jgi:transaldolase
MEVNMKFFLDSAKIDEVKYADQMWNINGVTTNPRHIYDSGRSFMTVIRELAEFFKGTEKKISVEIDPHLDKWEDMVGQAHEFASISPNFVIKIPSNETGFKACQVLTNDGIRCNVTLVFSALQALQAMRMGAFYVSPFIGWKESNGEATRSLIDEIVRIKRQYEFTSEIIVAAVRNGRQIVDAAILGADIVTAGFNVYKEGFDHPYTSLGLTKFQASEPKGRF